jgi:nitrogen fixation protein NifU and related proteins
MDEFEQMYHENILDHYKHPHNFGEMKNPDVRHHEHNPLCGDTLDMFLKIKEGKVEGVSFVGKGCAISQASASMLTDSIKGKSTSEVEKMTKENILEMLGITLSPVRLKCAMLSLDTAKNALHIHQKYMNGHDQKHKNKGG